MLVSIGYIVITGFNIMVASTCPVGCQCTVVAAKCDDSHVSEVPVAGLTHYIFCKYFTVFATPLSILISVK